MIDITLIIPIYNCNEDELSITLNSILKQKNIKYEIIFADDHSNHSYEAFINEFLVNTNIDYYYNRTEKNLGTVNNLLEGLKYAHSDFIKPLGAGDYFANDNALQYAVENKNDIVFMPPIGYIQENKKKFRTFFTNPINENPFIRKNRNSILKELLIFGDHLSGVGLFYKKYILEKYLNIIKENIKYVEDFIPILAILEGYSISYLSNKEIYYLIGTGISTDKKSDSRKRIKKDADSFDNFISSQFENDPIVAKYIKMIGLNHINSTLIRYILKFIFEPSLLIFYIKKKIASKNMYRIESEIIENASD